MTLQRLLRPSVLTSLAAHGGLVLVAFATVAPAPSTGPWRVEGTLVVEPTSVPPATEALPPPEDPRLDAEALVVAPEPPQDPPAEEIPDLAPLDASASVLAVPTEDRVPVGARVAPRRARVTPAAPAPAPTLAAAGPAGPVGHGVTRDAVRRPENPAPAYPPEAYAGGFTGTTWLVVQVLADGSVGSVTVEQSSGYRVLDAAAVDAVRGWAYEPRLVDGTPAPDLIRFPVRFRLR